MIRESGGDRSAVTGGTKLLSDRLVIEVTQEPGKSFLDRMIALVEGAERRKTPNEIALNILLAGLTITFVAAVATLRPYAIYAGTSTSQTVLIALLVALIPTTIGALLSAIGIAGMDRLVQRNVLAMSGRAVEASGDVDVLLLDKTGTITLGNRQAAEFLPVDSVRAPRSPRRSPSDPRGRIAEAVDRGAGAGRWWRSRPSSSVRVHDAQRRGREGRAGGEGRRHGEAVRLRAGRERSRRPDRLVRSCRAGRHTARRCQDNFALGVIHLKDIVGRHGRTLRRASPHRHPQGHRHGDNRVTAAVIAQEAGVDDFLAEATPGPGAR